MKFTTRRFIGDVLSLVGRSFEDTAEEIQEWAAKITRQVEGGIPGGFNDLTPTTIQAGVAGDPGSEGDGWMSAGATIPIETGTPNGLADSNAEGSGSALMRASALIKRDVRVFVDGIELSTRNALDIRGLDVTDDPANDRIIISLVTGGSLVRNPRLAAFTLRMAYEGLQTRPSHQKQWR